MFKSNDYICTEYDGHVNEQHIIHVLKFYFCGQDNISRFRFYQKLHRAAPPSVDSCHLTSILSENEGIASLSILFPSARYLKIRRSYIYVHREKYAFARNVTVLFKIKSKYFSICRSVSVHLSDQDHSQIFRNKLNAMKELSTTLLWHET